MVRHSDPAEDLHVATDCLTAMSAIQNGLLNSLSIHGHAEEASLRDAVTELHRRTRRTTFLKVKAHVGITLNEIADKEANAARKLPAPAAPAGGTAPSGQPAHGIVMANGEKATKKLIAEAYAVVRADIIRDAEAARVERAAAAEAAADGAGPSVPPPRAGQSVASKWQEAVEKHDYIEPTSYGFGFGTLNASLTRTLSRGRMMQGRPRAPCPLPGCGLVVNNAFHARGPSQNPNQSDLITSAANKVVHTIAESVSEGDLARWTLLINAGVAFAANGAEDQTIPNWMLPGAFGNRDFPDKVDLALFVGWGKGTPQPTLAQKRNVEIVLVEVGCAQDHYLPERVAQKHTRYVALVVALRDAGWKVRLCQTAGDPERTESGGDPRLGFLG